MNWYDNLPDFSDYKETLDSLVSEGAFALRDLSYAKRRALVLYILKVIQEYDNLDELMKMLSLHQDVLDYVRQLGYDG